MGIVLVRVSIAVKKCHDHSNSYKGKHLTKAVAYGFRGLVHYLHGREHSSWEYGSIQVDTTLENSAP